MYLFCALLILLCVCVNVLTSPACKLTDTICLEKSGPAFFANIFQSNPKIGTVDLDPMHHDVIVGNLSILKYKLTDSTVEGFKHCTIENFKFDSVSLGLQGDVLCPSLKMYGNYDIHGRLIVLPVEGHDKYVIMSKTYRISFEIALKVMQRKDGTSYAAVKNFRLKPEALEPVVYDFKNLFNGQRDLAEPVLKFANENWKEVTKEIQAPVMNANFKKIFKNVDKILHAIPMEDLI